MPFNSSNQPFTTYTSINENDAFDSDVVPQLTVRSSAGATHAVFRLRETAATPWTGALYAVTAGRRYAAAGLSKESTPGPWVKTLYAGQPVASAPPKIQPGGTSDAEFAYSADYIVPFLDSEEIGIAIYDSDDAGRQTLELNVSLAKIGSDYVIESAEATAVELLSVLSGEAAASTTPAIGSLYISATAGTDVVTAGTFVLVAGTTTAITEMDFTASASGRLTYNGAESSMFFVNAVCSVQSSSGSNILDTRIAKNGTPIAASEIRRRIGNSNEVGAFAMGYPIDLTTDDYIELWATDTDESTLTFDRMVLTIACA